MWFPYERLVVPFEYRGIAKSIVLALKRRADRSLAAFVAGTMFDAFRSDAYEPFDLVTWIPPGPSGRKRGFDQGELIARKVATVTEVDAVRLVRSTPRTKQRNLGRDERFVAAAASLTARSARGARVLLVDDVVTTGASMEAASLALRESGARSVACLAFARTPRRVGISSTSGQVRA